MFMGSCHNKLRWAGCHSIAEADAACSARSWSISKKGDLTEGRAREKAHQGRVSAVCAAGGFLYSASHDGSIKMWDATTMELVMAHSNAHAGTKIHCLAVGADGFLYTGGEDKVCSSFLPCLS